MMIQASCVFLSWRPVRKDQFSPHHLWPVQILLFSIYMRWTCVNFTESSSPPYSNNEADLLCRLLIGLQFSRFQKSPLAVKLLSFYLITLQILALKKKQPFPVELLFLHLYIYNLHQGFKVALLVFSTSNSTCSSPPSDKASCQGQLQSFPQVTA